MPYKPPELHCSRYIPSSLKNPQIAASFPSSSPLSAEAEGSGEEDEAIHDNEGGNEGIPTGQISFHPTDVGGALAKYLLVREEH